MGKWGRCMIFLVEVAGAQSDRATSGPIDISGICGVSGVSPDGKYLYFDRFCKKRSKISCQWIQWIKK